jgi:hypothetical protein
VHVVVQAPEGLIGACAWARLKVELELAARVSAWGKGRRSRPPSCPTFEPGSVDPVNRKNTAFIYTVA